MTKNEAIEKATALLNSGEATSQVADVIEGLISYVLAPQQEDVAKSTISICNSTVSHIDQKIAVGFVKGRVPFSFWPCINTGYSEVSSRIIVHKEKEEEWMPVYNFATSEVDSTDSVEKELLKQILAKYSVNLVICPKENTSSWDTL